MSMVIPAVQEQYSLRVPAHRFVQGGRQVYYFALDLLTADGFLPLRVDDAVIKDANRKLTPSHAKNIQNYLADKNDWLLGALMLGIAPDALVFEEYAEQVDFGELRIRTNQVNTMRIFDGQHRRRAIRDVLLELREANEVGAKGKYAELSSASITVGLYAEEDIRILRQMFVDASKTKRIEANTVARFNRRDPFNLVAMWLSGTSRLFKYRVEQDRSSVSRVSENLLAINQLASCLKTVEVGYGRRVTRDRSEECMRELNELQARCGTWANDFLPAAREEYEGLANGALEESEIPYIRAGTFLLSVTFLNLLAACYHRWTELGRDWQELARFIRVANLRSGGGHGLLVDAGLVAPDGKTLFTRRQEVFAAMSYIIDRATEYADSERLAAG